MNIAVWLMVVIGGAAGLLSTLYIVVAIFAVIIFKLYRKARYHISLYD